MINCYRRFMKTSKESQDAHFCLLNQALQINLFSNCLQSIQLQKAKECYISQSC